VRYSFGPVCGAPAPQPYDNTIDKDIDIPTPTSLHWRVEMAHVKTKHDNLPVYVISIAADLTGTHPRTLRIYEEKGLVQPARRNNNRLYSDQDLERVRLIRHLTQEMGLNLAGVKVLLEVSERLEYKNSRQAISWVFRQTVRRRRVP
jgi:MerR family transcriptional regulator/heat shock protein HspR